MKKNLGQIIRSTPFISFIGELECEITSIEYDSRKCKQNSCFVAMQGGNHDGNNFVDDAINNGAVAIVSEVLPNKENIRHNITYILVENSRSALAEISHSLYDKPSTKLKVIGITGTNGKTTTTFIIKSILEAAKKSFAIIGTTGIYIAEQKIESNLTTPESSDLAKLFSVLVENDVEYAIMEVSSVAIIMNRIDCINFTVAAFTNLTQDHLDIHQNMENYALAKKGFFDKLGKKTIVILNLDDGYSDFMIKDCASEHIFGFGHRNDAKYKILKESASATGNNFIIYRNNGIIDGRTKLFGKFNVENATLAATICDALQINLIYIQKGLSLSDGAPGRLQRVMLTNGSVAFVDYAHTPDALEKTLKTCKEMLSNNKNKLICVFGCGGDRDKAKRPIMGAISEKYADVAIITNDNPRTENPADIINEICAGINNLSKTITIPDREKAITKAVSISNSGDIILIAGKGHENYQIIGTEKLPFDDSEVLNKHKNKKNDNENNLR